MGILDSVLVVVAILGQCVFTVPTNQQDSRDSPFKYVCLLEDDDSYHDSQTLHQTMAFIAVSVFIA